MNIVIVGCGRVGAALAETFDRAGHRVVILDESTRAFDRLPGSFGGEAVRGDGTALSCLRGCLRYRESLDAQLPDAPRSSEEFSA